jgi:hypothetical protein
MGRLPTTRAQNRLICAESFTRWSESDGVRLSLLKMLATSSSTARRRSRACRRSRHSIFPRPSGADGDRSADALVCVAGRRPYVHNGGVRVVFVYGRLPRRVLAGLPPQLRNGRQDEADDDPRHAYPRCQGVPGVKDLLSYLAVAASAFVVQFLVQAYLVPPACESRRPGRQASSAPCTSAGGPHHSASAAWIWSANPPESEYGAAQAM